MDKGDDIMAKKVMLVLFAVVTIVLFAACVGPHAVQDGSLRDTIFAIETKQNGSHFVWMTHDDVGVYCTMNDQLFAQARAIFEDTSKAPEVILSYICHNIGSAESPAINILGTEGCRHEKATVYVITELVPVGQGE